MTFQSAPSTTQCQQLSIINGTGSFVGGIEKWCAVAFREDETIIFGIVWLLEIIP
jgi:hypothetical protein